MSDAYKVVDATPANAGRFIGYDFLSATTEEI